jgi:bifunctional UDP-N-acetylglucosamine pyrophosphorylase/glucosamine-1-phosphate N-acetyltransferase
MDGFDGDVVVLNADKPLFTPASVSGLVATHRQTGAAITLTAAELENPAGYGRILRGPDGQVEGIVEEREANDTQRQIREVNGGAYCFALSQIQQYLDRLPKHGPSQECYLTDIIKFAATDRKLISVYRSPDPLVVLGVNTLAERDKVEAVIASRRIARLSRECER